MMKKLFTLIGLICLTLNSYASKDQCREKLLGNFSENSAAFTLDSDEVFQERDFGRDYLAKGIFTIRALLKKVKCKRNDINFAKGPFGKSQSRCRLLVPHAPQSATCYIESSLGYFFITQDYLNNINIVYNRWD